MSNRVMMSSPETLPELIEQAEQFKEGIGETYQQYMNLYWKVEELRCKACGVGAIRYDKDRVSGGVPYTMADRVMDLIEVEKDLDHARMAYIIELNNFQQMMYLAELPVQTIAIWTKRYVQRKSIGQCAREMRINKWRAQYELEKEQYNRAFALVANEIVTNAEYE